MTYHEHQCFDFGARCWRPHQDCKRLRKGFMMMTMMMTIMMMVMMMVVWEVVVFGMV